MKKKLVSIPDSDYKKLVTIAKKNKRSINAEIQLAIQNHVK